MFLFLYDNYFPIKQACSGYTDMPILLKVMLSRYITTISSGCTKKQGPKEPTWLTTYYWK